MKRILALIVAAAAMALVAAGSASADVPRYQPTATLAVALTDAQPGNVHTYTITWTDPCGTTGAFTGVGEGSTTALGPYVDETITGTLVGDHLTFTAVYTDYIPGYTWTYDGTLAGPVALGGAATGYHATATVESITTYKNHGDYVNWAKAHGISAKVAGPSCLGRPIEWSTVGTVDSSSTSGATVALPDEGTYRIDVAGTWQNGPWYLVDAEYTEQSPGVWADGWPGYPTVDFGDLMVNGAFVNWGAYTSTHAYTYTAAFPAGTLNLRVWDMWGDLVTDGHADNVGSLDYTVTYVGP